MTMTVAVMFTIHTIEEVGGDSVFKTLDVRSTDSLAKSADSLTCGGVGSV